MQRILRSSLSMEAAWLALAHEQDWLDGAIAPNVKRTRE
jgi:hypothetical protein